MSAVIEFGTDLWKSILTPGVTPVLVQATHASFAALLTVLIGMLVATKSLHFVALSLIAVSLWAAITWFIGEVRKIQEEQKEQKEAEETSQDETVKSADTTATEKKTATRVSTSKKT